MKPEHLYKFLKPMTKLVFYRLYNVKEGAYVLPEEGQAFIMVGHHVSAFDPIILNSFSKPMIRFLYADANDSLKLRGTMLRALGMIPFSKNSADFKSIRRIKNHLKEGQAIGIYPEGGACWDGTTDPLIASTAKLIKMMGVPVYGVRYNGAYLSKPRWATHLRKGKVLMNTYQVFTKEELKELKARAIHERLVEALAYNEFEWNKKEKIAFKGKNLAQGIEKLLYYCPECGSFNKLHSHGDNFYCNQCNSSFSYDAYGSIHKGNGQEYTYQVPQWAILEKEQLKLKLDHVFTDVFPIRGLDVYKNSEKIQGQWFIHQNRISLDQEIELKNVKSQSITFNQVIKFAYGQDDYKLVFNHKSNLSIKLFYDIINILKED